MNRTKGKKRWSGNVTRHSNALDLKPAIFKSGSPRRIAISLKRSAQASTRRKGTPLQSAMSHAEFLYQPRRRKSFCKTKNVLTHAKEELQRGFGRA
jgi:hypothetical protein